MLYTNQLDHKSLAIRFSQLGSVPVLKRFFPDFPSDVHLKRTVKHMHNNALYLIGFVHDTPAGYAFITLGNEIDGEIKKRIPNCPILISFFTEKKYKPRNIEKLLLRECIQQTKRLGYTKIGILIDHTDPLQKLFFLKQGFINSGIETARGSIFPRSATVLYIKYLFD